jgi:hypothetical protein
MGFLQTASQQENTKSTTMITAVVMRVGVGGTIPKKGTLHSHGVLKNGEGVPRKKGKTFQNRES